MRICSPQLGLASNSILGGEVFDREILLGLAKRGVKIDIILPKSKPYDRQVNNFKIHTLFIKHFPAILGNILYIPSLIKLNRDVKIIRVHQPQFLGLGALFSKAVNRNIKIISTIHKFEESNFGPFSKVINNRWDHIVCDSKNVKQKLIVEYSLPDEKISVVHNGVPNTLKPAKKDKNLKSKYNLASNKVLLFMGFLNNRKNPLFLLRVLAKMKNPNIKLILLGQGPLKSKAVEISKILKISEQIIFIDPVFGEKKAKIHNLADIFVHPSLDEGFALAPLESMACAKPVIMSSGGSSSEAVDHGVNGYLCKENNVNDWVEKINKLLLDENLRKSMGAKSRAKVLKNFQWRHAVDIHFKIIKSLYY